MKTKYRYIIISATLLLVHLEIFAQDYSISGTIFCANDSTKLEYAQVIVIGTPLYTLSGSNGTFGIDKIEKGDITLQFSCYGYEGQKVNLLLDKNISNLKIYLKMSTLRIENVVVTATPNTNNSNSTSHTINRNAIELTQPLTVADITSLLPGGKSRGDISLVNSRGEIALRGVGGSRDLAAFGTGVEVDGVRMSNNASLEGASGFATRSLPLSNVESIEIITGIPSVVYGDISSGIVKINTKKSKTPLTVEALLRPNTKQFAASKGFSLGKNGGILNLSGEHTKSISDIASPHTSYQRNAVTINYLKFFKLTNGRNLLFDIGSSVNIGGFNDKDDPDKKTNNYIKVRDNNFRANLKLKYLPALSWLTSLELFASVNYTDNLTQENSSNSSASSLAAIHSTEQGYFIAESYNDNPNANIILREPGYWEELFRNDSKPLYITSKLIATWNNELSKSINNNLIYGVDYSMSKNLGIGLYYDNMRLAPTWREYRPVDDPAMNNFSIFIQDDLTWRVNDNSKVDIMAGLRYDITLISQSQYGTIGNLSPRFNLAYSTLLGGENIKNLKVYGGWGRGVKLPSFSMLYPRTTYSDRLAFSPGADANNTAFVAYYTQPNQPRYNPDLQWQYTDQIEVGFNGSFWNNNISIALFYTQTNNTYTLQNEYNPFAFKLTTTEHLTECPIPFSDRLYDIDQVTGIVTISDKTDNNKPWTAPYSERKIFNSSTHYANSSPIARYGIEWTIDFMKIKALSTTLRLDGNYTEYKGSSDIILQGTSSMRMSNGEPYQYIGHYNGSVGVANGSHTKELNLNLTANTHIPKIGMIFSIKLESTLITYSRNLSSTAFTVDGTGHFENNGGDIYAKDSYTAAYPLYYSTWDNPNTLIPFEEKFLWAKQNDSELYNDLSKLVKTSNSNYFFRPQTVTPYFSINLSITKELSNWGSLSFYATNFLNNIGSVTSSWNYGSGTLYNSNYIPQFYYGMTFRLLI